MTEPTLDELIATRERIKQRIEDMLAGEERAFVAHVSKRPWQRWRRRPQVNRVMDEVQADLARFDRQHPEVREAMIRRQTRNQDIS